MQFVAKGPHVPISLLQAHEENRVVFFCGAGISYLAGLPGFKGLVERIYKQLGAKPNESESAECEQGRYDVALYLLEQRYPGHRIAVRKSLIAALQPDYQRPESTETHASLLQLASDRNGKLRLVTTNYDRIFEYIASRSEQQYDSYVAPALPVSKVSHWNGLVYLHGLLPLDENDENALQRLVLSSGDFGLAYLKDKWAARFVNEIIGNYVLCFVGYSVNDPIFRFMMEAFQVDRMLGNSTPEVYAFRPCGTDQGTSNFDVWSSMGIEPIPYELQANDNRHVLLHRTLKVWAETYRDGVFAKERIVNDYAQLQPSSSSQQDDFAGRVIWALADQSGLPAKRFAECNPTPSLEWLPVIFENFFGSGQSSYFGNSIQACDETNSRFSSMNQAAPYKHTSRFLFIRQQPDSTRNDVIHAVAHWLTRHLNNPLLIYWLVKNESPLHVSLPNLIESKLDEYDRLNGEGESDVLNEIRQNSPDAIPDDETCVIWRLLLSGRVKLPQIYFDLSTWLHHLERNGLSASLRLELRDFLAPMIALKAPLSRKEKTEEASYSKHSGQKVNWELVLAADDVQSVFRNRTDEHWQAILPELLDDFQQLLRDALGILRELGKADDYRDGSYVDQPSIHHHWRNRGRCDWVLLIELLRDAWFTIQSDEPKRAGQIAIRWFEFPYPTFKRLAFYAASHDDCIDVSLWFEWLMSNDCCWLWSEETQREVMRLLVLQGKHLTSFQERLEATILKGPPRNMFPDHIKPESWQSMIELSTWLRLAKLKESGLKLGENAQNRLNTLSEANPDWQFTPHQSEEFQEFRMWMVDTEDSDLDEKSEADTAPLGRRELVQWLKVSSHRQRSPSYSDNWHELCHTHTSLCYSALSDLTKEGDWPVERWRAALHVWSQESTVEEQFWCNIATLIGEMPDDSLRNILRSVALWLDATSKSVGKHRYLLVELCQRILHLSLATDSSIALKDEFIQRPVTDALNHPVGMVAKILLNLWLRGEPQDNERLLDDIEPLFRKICTLKRKQLRYGRVLLASRLSMLFRVDQQWTERYLLPFFKWKKENLVEAQVVWEGFLWCSSLYQPLLDAFKSELVETASHYDNLSEFKQKYATYLTYAALENLDGEHLDAYQSAFEYLPSAGLQEVADTLTDILESHAARSEDYWFNRIEPFWLKMWPKSHDYRSSGIAASLVLMCIAAGKKFPNTVELVRHWLLPVKHPHYAIKRLQESDLCTRFPKEVLDVLNLAIKNPLWKSSELGQCLTAISNSKPELLNDPNYQRLLKYAL